MGNANGWMDEGYLPWCYVFACLRDASLPLSKTEGRKAGKVALWRVWHCFACSGRRLLCFGTEALGDGGIGRI